MIKLNAMLASAASSPLDLLSNFSCQINGLMKTAMTVSNSTTAKSALWSRTVISDRKGAASVYNGNLDGRGSKFHACATLFSEKNSATTPPCTSLTPCDCPCQPPCSPPVCPVSPCPPCCPCLRVKGTKENLLHTLHQRKCDDVSTKVTVVGAGQVGMATVASLLFQGVSNNVAIVDINADKLTGETLDLMHGSNFVNAKVTSSTDYKVSAGSKICVITAGVRQKDKESRLDLVKRNTDVYKKIIPEMVKYSPDAIFVIASNPVDILAYATWKISKLPKHRIIGSGTIIDSARFRYLVAQRLGVSTRSVQGYIIGEHGNSMVPVWSSLNVAGASLCNANPFIGTDCDPERWKDIHSTLLTTAYKVRSWKGFTNWAIATSVTHIVKSILTDSNDVFCASTFVQGLHGITDEVFLSLPVCMCSEGVKDIIKLWLSQPEYEGFAKCAQLMAEIQEGLKF